MESFAVEILSVAPGSLAQRAGIQPGNRLIEVNGRAVRDFLDLQLWLGEDILDLTLEKTKRGETFGTRIIREYGEELGLTFPDAQIRRCANDCPFCFVDQLPEGLRKNLYIRDDDYRFSYLYGHFVTLTNLKEWEFERILDQELSPLYVSVHALDPEIREKVLKSKRAGEIRDRIEQLLAGGITLHTQIVVVPGVNDGEVLSDTIFGLAEYHPGVASVSVVPVGLTGHRRNLPDVRTLAGSDSRSVARMVRRYGRTMKRRLGHTFCFVADELLVHAGLPIPPASYYGDFGQLENGVGMIRDTLTRFATGTPNGAAIRERGIERVWLGTGESFGAKLRRQLPRLQKRFPEISLEMVEVENTLFGRPVTVAGLLGGKDLLEACRDRVRPGDMLLVPGEAVNENGMFLDDWTPETMSRELGVPVAYGWDPLIGIGVAHGGLEGAFIDVPGEPAQAVPT